MMNEAAFQPVFGLCVDCWSVVTCFWQLAGHDHFVLEGKELLFPSRKMILFWGDVFGHGQDMCAQGENLYIRRSGQVS